MLQSEIDEIDKLYKDGSKLKAEFYESRKLRIFEIKDGIDGPVQGYITYIMIRINRRYALTKAFENENIKNALSFMDELNKKLESNCTDYIDGLRLVNLYGGDLGRE